MVATRKRVLATVIVLKLVPGLCAVAGENDKCEGGPLVRGRCIEVVGDLEIWNGWPPNMRIEASHKLYGVGPIEKEIYPDYLGPYIFKELSGTFRICPLGKNAAVPYLDEPIPLYCLVGVTNGTYKRSVGSERQPLPAPPK